MTTPRPALAADSLRDAAYRDSDASEVSAWLDALRRKDADIRACAADYAIRAKAAAAHAAGTAASWAAYDLAYAAAYAAWREPPDAVSP